jgi:endogenous inhibitor of DNA gyrase (YacG/DUF329 family)
MGSAPRLLCPTCKRELSWSEQFPWRPFCSERCKMVDLGAWLANDRGIPGEPVDPSAEDASPAADPPA